MLDKLIKEFRNYLTWVIDNWEYSNYREKEFNTDLKKIAREKAMKLTRGNVLVQWGKFTIGDETEKRYLRANKALKELNESFKGKYKA